ncbi:MAG: hypothetical protein P4K97_00265 [Terracidiphilus sp.]|nr:hypothetical protein [Terracidiphilus sp.]
MISLLTVSLIAISTELIARRIFPHTATSVYNCIVQDDPTTGFRAIPNSVCWGKEPEGPLVQYKFNSCGQRSGMECGLKKLGHYRVLLSGSSIAMGDMVQQDEAFSELLPLELTRRSGRQVDVYNEGMLQESPAIVKLRLKGFIANKPDTILWILTSWDLQHTSVTLPFTVKATDKRVYGSATRQHIEEALAAKSILDGVHILQQTVHDVLDTTLTKYMLQHFLYKSQSQYVTSALRAGDGEAYLRCNLSPEWLGYLSQFNISYAEIERQAAAAGVPLVVAFMPNRAQAAMISLGEWPSGYDPYKLDNDLRNIVVSHGGTYIDILPDFRNIPNPEQYFYPVDGHPNPQGHAIIANLLAKELTSGAVPELSINSH